MPQRSATIWLAGRRQQRSSARPAATAIRAARRLRAAWSAAIVIVGVSVDGAAQDHGGPTFQRSLQPAATGEGSQLRLHVSEEFLNRLVARSESRQSQVRDFVLGADVYGHETTHTDVRLDLRLDPTAAAADMVLHGRNFPDTLGYTSQAVVHTLGFHEFTARKLVVFDGRLFHTQRPRVSVVPCNQTVGIWTPFSGAPLIGPLVTAFAFDMAQQRRAEGEAVAAQKIGERVGPEFNQSLDEQLARLNRGSIGTLTPLLKELGWEPDQVNVFSTDDALSLSVRYADAPQPAALPSTSPHRGLTIAIHESMLNRAFDRLMLEDTTLAPADADAYWFRINDVLQTWSAAAEPAAGPAPSAGPPQGVAIRLGPDRPVQVEFGDDRAVLTTQAALTVPPVIETPLLNVVIEFGIERTPDAITFAPQQVRIQPADPNQPGFGAMAPVIEQQALASVRPLSLPRQFRLPLEDLANVQIELQDIIAADGWLILLLDATTSSVQPRR